MVCINSSVPGELIMAQRRSPRVDYSGAGSFRGAVRLRGPLGTPNPPAQHGLIGVARGRDRGYNFLAAHHAFAANPEGICKRNEIGSNKRCGHVPLVVEKLLPLADHAEIAVVDDSDFDV